MKKIVYFSFLFVFAFILGACSNNESDEVKQKESEGGTKEMKITEEAAQKEVAKVVDIMQNATQMIEQYDTSIDEISKNEKVSKAWYDFEMVNETEVIVGQIEVKNEVTVEEAETVASELFSKLSIVNESSPVIVKVHQDGKLLVEKNEKK